MRELGPARFGVIGLAWAVLEYLTMLDAGLGRATVHFVARRLRDPGGVPGDVVSASVLAQLLLRGLHGLAQLGQVELAALARGLDKDAGERHQPSQALRADRGLAGAPVPAGEGATRCSAEAERSSHADQSSRPRTTTCRLW